MNFSIVVPYYNASSTIGRLIDSIPCREDIEIIISDDNSSVEEREKLNEILYRTTSHTINVIRSDINKGAGHARNLALKHAIGKWLIFADADDYFTEYFSDALFQYQNADVDMIYFNAVSIKLPENTYSERHLQINRWITEKCEKELRFSFHGPVCKFVKRDLVRRNEIFFFESYAFNDALFSAKVGYYADDIMIVDLPIYCITETKDSTTYSISPQILQSRIDAIIAINNFYSSISMNEYKMGLFPHLVYSRKLGVIGIFFIFIYIIRKRANPFTGLKNFIHNT